MTAGAAVRGCGNYSDWGSTYQPSPEACVSYCAQNGASACEWEESSGGCWVEFGDGCYVESGYGGWYSAVLSQPTAAGGSISPTGPAVLFVASRAPFQVFGVMMAAMCLAVGAIAMRRGGRRVVFADTALGVS